MVLFLNKIYFKIQTRGLEAFSIHLNNTDKCVKFTPENVKENSLAFLDCALQYNVMQKLLRKSKK